jgi:hypothetical protein
MGAAALGHAATGTEPVTQKTPGQLRAQLNPGPRCATGRGAPFQERGGRVQEHLAAKR